MSATAATARAARTAPSYRRGQRPAPRPRLRVVAAPPPTRHRLPFAAACAALLVVSLLGLLVLNISLSRGAYRVHELQQRSTALAEQEQLLGEQLAAHAAPAQLAVQARQLGMVPGTSPGFIRLSDGAILGAPEPAPAVPAPSVVIAAPPAPSDTPATAVSPPATEATEPAPDPAAEAAAAAAAAAAAQAEQAAAADVGDGAVPVIANP